MRLLLSLLLMAFSCHLVAAQERRDPPHPLDDLLRKLNRELPETWKASLDLDDPKRTLVQVQRTGAVSALYVQPNMSGDEEFAPVTPTFIFEWWPDFDGSTYIRLHRENVARRAKLTVHGDALTAAKCRSTGWMGEFIPPERYQPETEEQKQLVAAYKSVYDVPDHRLPDYYWRHHVFAMLYPGRWAGIHFEHEADDKEYRAVQSLFEDMVMATFLDYVDTADDLPADQRAIVGWYGDDQAWRAMTHEAPLGEYREAIHAAARPGLKVLYKEATDNEARMHSHFAGRPDLPPGTSWPAIDGESYKFLGQIRLDELPALEGMDLPKDGMLYFYYGRDIFYPENKGWFPVVYHPDTKDLKTAAWPDDLDPKRQAAARLLAFVNVTTPPELGSFQIQKIGLPDDLRETYGDLCTRWDHRYSYNGPMDSDHRIGGFPGTIQGAMESVCFVERFHPELRTREEEPTEAEEKALRTEFLDKNIDGQWVLLLQVDSEFEAFGDNGSLYYWIHRDDLKRRDFSKTVAIVQCF